MFHTGYSTVKPIPAIETYLFPPETPGIYFLIFGQIF